MVEKDSRGSNGSTTSKYVVIVESVGVAEAAAELATAAASVAVAVVAGSSIGQSCRQQWLYHHQQQQGQWQ